MKQPIFLSLGSNYTFGFALTAIRQLIRPSATALTQSRYLIEQQLGGKPIFYYKGRDAIEQALLALQRKHSQRLVVFTQAAACYAIEEAITRAGAQVEYVDVGERRLNLTVQTLQSAFERAGKPRHAAVIVQHLLGFPAAVERIKTWCDTHNVVLIEDVAQSYGALTRLGNQVGTIGDIVVGSFGRDKILDCVTGGFALVRNMQVAPEPKTLPNQVPTIQLLRDLLYPITTWKIRTFHAVGIGRILFWIAKRMGLLASPILSPLPVSSGLPIEFGALLNWQLRNLESQRAHRIQVAHMYFSQLQPWISALHIVEADLNTAISVRMPLLVPDVEEFILYLKKQSIYVSDRWYRSAVDQGQFNAPSLYKTGSCPNAELLTQHLCNLPTHIAISVKEAELLARFVRQYMHQPKIASWYKDVLKSEVKL